jgi:flagella basal body P-ring formation protein FlgA
MKQSLCLENPRAFPLVVMVFYFAMLLPTAGWSLENEDRISIKMQSKVTVDGDKILLGDIAVIESRDSALVRDLKKLVLGRAPLPGNSRRIEAAYVTLRLKQRGIPNGRLNLSDNGSTTVARSSIIMSQDDIKRIIQDALFQKKIFQGERAEIKEIQVGHDLVLPSGRVSCRVDFEEKPLRSNQIPVSVTIFVNGRQYRKIWARLVAEIQQEVVVLKHAMRRYQSITAEDIRMDVMQIADIPVNAIRNEQEIIGKRVKKSLLSGTVLRSDMVELPPLVKRGDVVTLLATSGVLYVKALGKVKNSGRQGDRVRIVNLDTRKELYGYVLDSKTVQVFF